MPSRVREKEHTEETEVKSFFTSWLPFRETAAQEINISFLEENDKKLCKMRENEGVASMHVITSDKW